MQPIFENYENGFGSVLCCPKCGGNYLHHTRTEIFERGEDDKEGNHVIVDRQKFIVDRNLKNNPSLRRHGIKIFFYCEYCGPQYKGDDNCVDIVMTIVQHKGETLVNITEISKRCDDGSADT